VVCLVGHTGLEPATTSFEDWDSILWA